jgi:hypothetical protein
MSAGIPIRIKRDELIAKLEKLHASALKQDKMAAEKHARDEQAFLVRFKAAAKSALKDYESVVSKVQSWDYKKLRDNHFYVSMPDLHYRKGAPRCPDLKAARIARLLAMVKASNMKTFTVSKRGQYGSLWELLTEKMPEEKSVC